MNGNTATSGLARSKRDPRAYLELLRLPNVFTAWADVLMGFLVVGATWSNLAACLTILAASTCLYLAGMVLNDLFDMAQDAVERPHRPIPSGRVIRATAARMGYGLLLGGLMLALLAALLGATWRTPLIGLLLALAIFAYDAVLKRTPLGPWAMGSCRFFNVLLGMSVVNVPFTLQHYCIAAGIGVYIAGLTWFARTEAKTSQRLPLVIGIAIMAAGIGLLAAFPAVVPPGANLIAPIPLAIVTSAWFLLIGLLGANILWRALFAVTDPAPQRVQAAVKHGIVSLIVLDAAVSLAVRGPLWGALLLLLLLPTLFLGRWIYST
jgi:4-hydroxybenzoate polyprenyltransferase